MLAGGAVDAARTVGTPTRSGETGGERSLPDGPDGRTPDASGTGEPAEPPGRTSVADT
jgi:hypothetical protein